MQYKLSHEEIDKRKLSLANYLLSDNYIFKSKYDIDYRDLYCNLLPDLLAEDILYVNEGFGFGCFFVLPSHEEWLVLTDKEADEGVEIACDCYCDSDCEYEWFMAAYPEDAWKLVEKHGRGIALSSHNGKEIKISNDYFAYQCNDKEAYRCLYSKYGELGDGSSPKEKERSL